MSRLRLNSKLKLDSILFHHADGDPRRVVDIVRASAIFTTMRSLANAIEALLEDGSALVVVRAKVSHHVW